MVNTVRLRELQAKITQFEGLAAAPATACCGFYASLQNSGFSATGRIGCGEQAATSGKSPKVSISKRFS
jgi:hypothetical protein